MNYQPKLREQYKSEIVPALMKEFNYKSVMQVPRLLKISLNQGIGAALADKKLIDYGVEEMTAITGQKAVPTISRHDVSNFKLRRGNPIGVRVTLRGDKMYEFLERLVFVTSEVLTTKVSMAAAITASVSPNRSSSQRSTWTKSTRSTVWISLSSHQRTPTRKQWPC